MEENLRNIDDHLNLYTLEPPKPPGSPFPAVAHEGDGQIYSDGTYAVLNAGSWVRYPARKGVLVMLQDGTEAWQSTGAQWQKASALDTAPVIAAAEAAIRPLAEAAAIDASRAENAAAVATAYGNRAASIAEGMAANPDGTPFTVYPGGVDSLKYVTVFKNSLGVPLMLWQVADARELETVAWRTSSLEQRSDSIGRRLMYRDKATGVVGATLDGQGKLLEGFDSHGRKLVSALAFLSAPLYRDKRFGNSESLFTESGGRSVIWMNESGEIDFLPSQSFLERIGPMPAGLAWRGDVPPIGPVRTLGADLALATVQDRNARVYDAVQRRNGPLPTFVVRNSAALEFFDLMGQSNAGAPRPYLSGSFDEVPYQGHVLMVNGSAQVSTGYDGQAAADYVDLAPAMDQHSNNNYLATLAGIATEYHGYRRGGLVASPGILTHTTWSGGQGIEHFAPGASGSYWWGNAMLARQQCARLAGLYGRSIVERWVTWVQGESAHANYYNLLNAFIDQFRPAARDAIGQASEAIFAIVQTNVGDYPDPEPTITLQEATNLAQLKVANDRFSDGVRMIGPMYHCPIVRLVEDNIHTDIRGRMILAEMIAQARTRELIQGVPWRPLQPISCVRIGTTITLEFDQPGDSLAWDTDWIAPIANKGFAFTDSTNSADVTAAELVDGNVMLTLNRVPTGESPMVQYGIGRARDATNDGWATGRGQLMSTTKQCSLYYQLGYDVPKYINNYCVKFAKAVS